ncbi:MAG: hypothetical protein V1774_04920 [Candidatus Eisenbacteria bacterium]
MTTARSTLQLLCLILLAAFPPARAQSWQEGLSATSVGRFGWWPAACSVLSYYEETLDARVWPDRLERTIAGDVWTLGFGAGPATASPAEVVAITTLNWIAKGFTVQRGTAQYQLLLNCVSPGVWLKTGANRIYLSSADSLGFMAYMSSAGVRVVDFDDPPGGGPAYDRPRDGSWSESWLLVWYGPDSPLARQSPVLLTLSEQPEAVHASGSELAMSFLMMLGDTVGTILSLPYGVRSFDFAETADWSTALPDSVVERCRFTARLCAAFPIAVTETFQIDEPAGRVHIRDRFEYRRLNDPWQTPAPDYAPLPPLISFARDHGYALSTPDPDPTATGYLTKYGELEIVAASDSCAYSLLLPPQHNVHLLPGAGGIAERRVVTDCIDHWTNELVWDLNKGTGGGAWSLATLNGRFASLLTVDPLTRGRFIDKAREILDEVTLDFGAATTPYLERYEPTTGDRFHYLIRNDTCPTYPVDPDAGAGANLEFIWEYGLYSGDWDYLASKWPEIENVFAYLRLVNDWAYLASACREFGGGGSFLDMFPAQWMGYLAYSQIARAVGQTAAYQEGLYLASRSLVPLAVRFQFEPYAARFFPFAGGQIVSGFGECEPNGALTIPWCGAPVVSLVGWNDKTVAGESFHPLVYDLYGKLVPDDFAALLLEGEALNGGGFNFQNAEYCTNHIYAFGMSGRDSAWVADKWALANTAEAAGGSYEELFGPSFLSRKPFLSALLATADVPIRLGSWIPAVIDHAQYSPENATLSLYLHNPSPQPARIAILAPDEPLWAMVDGMPASWSYDPFWEVVTLVVEGTGNHEVIAAFPPAAGSSPSPTFDAPDTNFAVNGGFEECGFDRPNYVRPWGRWANACSRVDLEHSVVHEGEQALRFWNYYCDSTDISVHQNIYFGPGNAYTLSLWYNIPFDIPEHAFEIILQEFQDCHNAAQRSWAYFPPPEQIPSDGWQQMIIEVNDHGTLPDAAICRLGLRLRDSQGGRVYVDDIVFTCPALSAIRDPQPPAHTAGQRPGVRCGPNPFVDRLAISWSGTAQSHPALVVLDVLGRRLRTFGAQDASAGRIFWDGRDSAGRPVPAGIYWIGPWGDPRGTRPPSGLARVVRVR